MNKLLIIDDDLQFCEILTLQFQKIGLASDFVSNQIQAIQALERNQYSVILLDVFLPNKSDGLELLVKLHANKVISNIPIILMTSMPTELFLQEDNVAQYLHMAKFLISKSDDLKNIVSRVHEILQEQAL